MSLKNTVEEDLKTAMRAKDKDTLRALRAIKSLILLEATKEGGTEELDADTEMRLLTKAAKQRRESADIYQQQGRADLAEAELQELAVIERYLPKQLTEDEVRTRLAAIITRVGAQGPQDMGKVMGLATRELAGQAEGRTLSALAKTLLEG